MCGKKIVQIKKMRGREYISIDREVDILHTSIHSYIHTPTNYQIWKIRNSEKPDPPVFHHHAQNLIRRF